MIPIPKPSDHFMPKKHGALLSTLITEAWQVEQDKLREKCATLAVAEILAAWLESRNPPADMAVLRRYGKTETVETVYVRAYDPVSERWSLTDRLDLPRKIEVARNADTACVCGKRWSREPNRGCERENMTEERFREICAFQDAQEADFAPESVDPYFAALVAARSAYKAEYRISTEWPAAVRKERGQWPLWREIEERFPILGAHVARQRQVTP